MMHASRGLVHMHGAGIVRTDLERDNIMFDTELTQTNIEVRVEADPARYHPRKQGWECTVRAAVFQPLPLPLLAEAMIPQFADAYTFDEITACDLLIRMLVFEAGQPGKLKPQIFDFPTDRREFKADVPILDIPFTELLGRATAIELLQDPWWRLEKFTTVSVVLYQSPPLLAAQRDACTLSCQQMRKTCSLFTRALKDPSSFGLAVLQPNPVPPELKLEIKAGLLGALEYLSGSCTSQVGPPAGLVSYPLVPFWSMEY
ncbi:hypothetical protein M405DRAFT_886145 [Rhizopogon salebrosus TDB-379]|nr:hypothetical protein M405DRAFT_886145 [Rhizopogon salebrosus TDB-379]